MEEDEKFEKFANALREHVHKVDEMLLAEGKGKRMPPSKAEAIIDELKYYLENQEKIKEELEEPLDEYHDLYDSDIDDRDEIINELERIDNGYDTIYLRSTVFYDDDEIVKYVRSLSDVFWVDICYTYDGSTLTFGIWNFNARGGPVEFARIAVNTRLLFKNEEELKDLIEEIASHLGEW